MYLHSLQLRAFRNYADQAVQFDRPKIILLGDNAQGKSNLLEAIELLATLKSQRALRDRELVLSTQTQGGIQAKVERLGVTHELEMELRVSGRRSLRVNGQLMARQFDFLGQINAVLFSSQDLGLVRGGPETRRDWLDSVLLQLEPVYSHLMEQYRRVLKQRNALLKAYQNPTGASQAKDPSLLSSWNSQLVTTGTRVMRRRLRLLERLSPLAQAWHMAISGGQEILTLIYRPQVTLSEGEISADSIQAQFWEQIATKRRVESLRGTSLVGPHRDDVELALNQVPARSYGSQGQQRTLVLALKLAELELIEQVLGGPPLLLLDDVLAELDLHRQNQLLDAIQDRVQTLVTATHLTSFDSSWLGSAQIFQVNQGQLSARNNSHRGFS